MRILGFEPSSVILEMLDIQFDVNVAIGVDIGIANDVLPVLWIEVYSYCVIQSQSM